VPSFKEIRDDVIKLADAGAQTSDINEYLSARGYTPQEFAQANENFGTFTSAVKRGGKGIGMLLGDIAPAMVGYVGEQIGIPGAKAYKERQMAEAAATQQEMEKLLPAQYESYEDVKGMRDVPGYVMEAIGEGLPSFIPSVVTGGAAGVLGRGAVAKAGQVAADRAKKAALAAATPEELVSGYAQGAASNMARTAARDAMTKKALQYEALGAFAGSGALNVPEAFQSIYSETGQMELLPAIAAGGFNAVLDAITPISLLRSAKGKGISGEAIIGEWYKRGAKELGKGFLTEGATESIQEMSNAAASKFVDENKEFFTPENLVRFIDAGLKGGVAGGGIQGAFGVAFGKKPAAEAAPMPPTPGPGPLTPAQANATPMVAETPMTPLTPEGVSEAGPSVAPARDITGGVIPATQLPEDVTKMRPIIGPNGTVVGYEPMPTPAAKPELTGEQLYLQPSQGDLFSDQPMAQPTTTAEATEPTLPTKAEPITQTVQGVVKAAKEDPAASKILKANNVASANIVTNRIQALMPTPDADPVEAMERLYLEDKTGKYPAGTKALSDAQRELLETTYRRITGRDIEDAIKERAFMGAQQGELFGGQDGTTEGGTQPIAGTAPGDVGVPAGGPGAPGEVTAPAAVGVAGSQPDVGGPAGGAVTPPVAVNPEEAWNVHKNDDHPAFTDLSPEEQAAWSKAVAAGRGNAVNFQDIASSYLERTSVAPAPAFRDVPAITKGEGEKIGDKVKGKTAVEVADWIAQNGPDKFKELMQKVAARLREFKKEGFKYSFHIATPAQKARLLAQGAAGMHSFTYKAGVRDAEIIILPEFADYETIIHELLHAVTTPALFYAEHGARAKNTQLAAYAKELKEIADIAIAEMNKRIKEGTADPFLMAAYSGVTNALGSTDQARANANREIISWAMTNSQMQKFMESIPYKNGNLFSKFVQAMRKFLGLAPKTDSLLSGLMRVSEGVIGVPMADVYAMSKAAKVPMPKQGIKIGEPLAVEPGDVAAAVTQVDYNKKAPWSEREIPNQFGRESALTDMYKRMQESYDESYSPDDAYLAAYENATPEEQYILRELYKNNMLGFDYPHQAVAAILQDPTAYDLSTQLKTAISKLGNKVVNANNGVDDSGVTNTVPPDTQYDAQVLNTPTPAPAPGGVVPAPGQPYTLPKLTKLQQPQSTAQQVKTVATKVTNAWNSDDFWTKFRIAAVDPTAGLAKTLSSLPVFQNGQLRADMLIRSFNQVINLIKNGLQTGIPVINEDGTVIIQRDENNMARSVKLADELDKNPTVKGSGWSGRGYVGEIARILRGREIQEEDARLRAKAALMIADAKMKMAQARQARASGMSLTDIAKLVNEAKALRREAAKFKNINREKQVTQAHIDWADQQLKAVPQVQEIFDIWRAVNMSLIDLWENSGLLTSREAANYRQKTSYVPLYAAREDLAAEKQEAYTGQRTGTKTVRMLEHLDGADIQRNIWENMDKHYASMVAAAYQNQTRRIAVDQLRALGAAKISTTSDDDRINLRYKDPSNPNADANGVVHVILDNPNDLAAFQMMHYELGPLMKGLSATTQVLRAGALINPMYWLKQLIRDPIHASIVAQSGIITPFHAFKEYVNILANNSEEARLLASRGVIGQVDSTIDLADYLKNVGTEKINPSMLDKMMHKVMQMHEASDAATRVSIFKKAKADGLSQGMSEKEATDYAVFRAREAINFAVRGNSKTLNALRHMIPFFSAAITSLDTMYRAATGYGLNPAEKKKAQELFRKRAAMMVVLSTAYAMMLQDDDDYKKLPDNVKDNNWLFPNPFGGGHSFIKIPVPFEVGFLFKTIPEAGIRYMAGTSTGKEVLASYALGLQRNLPGEGVLIPQAAKPALEAITNYSFFTGRPIEGMSDQGLPVAMRGPNASEVAKIMSKYGLDTIGISPAKFDHLMQGYMAELGTFTTGTASAAIAAATGKEGPAKNIEQMPFFKNFMTNPNTSKAATDFYDIMHNSQETVNALNRMKKEGRMQEAKEFMSDEEKRKLAAIAPTMRKVQENMSKIRQRINQIEESKGMDPETKRVQINKLMEMYDKVAQQGYRISEKAGISR